MRLLLVVNTSASSVTARARVVIHKALSADHEVVMKETNRRGHAARLAQGAAADGLDAVVVLGGDGTLNEAANGLAGSPTALAVLPGGSTNVFARTIGMANDPIEATSQLLSALAAGSVERVGLGQANARYFLFHAGIGFDAAVVAGVEKLASLKRYAGPALVPGGSPVHLGARVRPPPPGLLGELGRRAGDRRRLLRRLPQHGPVHVPRQPARAPGAGDVPRRRRSALVVLRKLTLRAVLPVAVSAFGEGLARTGRQHTSVLTSGRRGDHQGAPPGPLPGRRRLRGRVRAHRTALGARRCCHWSCQSGPTRACSPGTALWASVPGRDVGHGPQPPGLRGGLSGR